IPSLSLVKAAVYTGDSDRSEVGDEIEYTFTVTNTGNVTMEDIVVTDIEDEFTGENDISMLTFEASSEDSDEGTLLPGEVATYTATYTITQQDINQGGVVNTAEVTGTSPDGPSDPMTPEGSVPGNPDDPATPLNPD